jgi:hypothetical protein
MSARPRPVRAAMIVGVAGRRGLPAELPELLLHDWAKASRRQ